MTVQPLSIFLLDDTDPRKMVGTHSSSSLVNHLNWSELTPDHARRDTASTNEDEKATTTATTMIENDLTDDGRVDSMRDEPDDRRVASGRRGESRPTKCAQVRDVSPPLLTAGTSALPPFCHHHPPTWRYLALRRTSSRSAPCDAFIALLSPPYVCHWLRMNFSIIVFFSLYFDQIILISIFKKIKK